MWCLSSEAAHICSEPFPTSSFLVAVGDRLQHEFLSGGGFAILLTGQQSTHAESLLTEPTNENQPAVKAEQVNLPPLLPNGRPRLFPLPPAQDSWTCEVVVIGGSLGGVAAASHAMQSGATTCLIELAPWLGGQISSQGVSAIDESNTMRQSETFSESWLSFKRRIQQQWVKLPDWTGLSEKQQVAGLNSCWVGTLCFPPEAGEAASEQLLKDAAAKAPGSHWGTAIAFKGQNLTHQDRKLQPFMRCVVCPAAPSTGRRDICGGNL